MKKVRVIFSPEAEEVYKYLNKQAHLSKTENMILNALNKKIELSKQPPVRDWWHLSTMHSLANCSA